MSVLPHEQKRQDNELTLERGQHNESALSRVAMWNGIQGSREWKVIHEIVSSQLAMSREKMEQLDPSKPHYDTQAAFLNGHIRALKWLVHLPDQAIKMEKATLNEGGEQ